MNIPPDIAEQQLVARLMVAGAKNLSESMEKFVHWMVAGFAAGLTYIIGQKAIAVGALEGVGTLFIVSCVASVVQRYISMGVSSTAGIFQEAGKLGESQGNIDFHRFLLTYIRCVPRPVRWAAAGATEDMLRGNFTRIPRLIFWAAFVQCMIGAGIAIMLLRVAFLVLANAKFPSP